MHFKELHEAQPEQPPQQPVEEPQAREPLHPRHQAMLEQNLANLMAAMQHDSDRASGAKGLRIAGSAPLNGQARNRHHPELMRSTVDCNQSATSSSRSRRAKTPDWWLWMCPTPSAEAVRSPHTRPHAPSDGRRGRMRVDDQTSDVG
jgi:hypothetical protein